MEADGLVDRSPDDQCRRGVGTSGRSRPFPCRRT